MIRSCCRLNPLPRFRHFPLDFSPRLIADYILKPKDVETVPVNADMLKKDMIVKYENKLWKITKFMHRSMQQRAPVISMELRELETDAKRELNVKASTKFEEALYKDAAQARGQKIKDASHAEANASAAGQNGAPAEFDKKLEVQFLYREKSVVHLLNAANEEIDVELDALPTALVETLQGGENLVLYYQNAKIIFAEVAAGNS